MKSPTLRLHVSSIDTIPNVYKRLTFARAVIEKSTKAEETDVRRSDVEAAKVSKY